MRQAEAAQHPPDRAAVDVDAMDLGQLCGQFVERDLALVGDAPPDPVGHARKLAVPAAVALGPRLERSGVAPKLDQFVGKPRRHPEVPCRLAMPVAVIDERNDALA